MKPPIRGKKSVPSSLPPLFNGDEMDQPEFHRRYQQYPDDKKFELIGGIVYMASPVKRPHWTLTFKLAAVLGTYEANTPGVEGGDNQTAILDDEAEPQPDLLLRILPECGGQSDVDAEEYLVGAPELVLEVAYSTRSIDLHKKRQDYLRAGVQEYFVYCIQEQEIHWFHFPSKRTLKADKNGVWKSKVFPGLWIDGPALVAKNAAGLLNTLQKGLASQEHAAFVRRLRGGRKSGS